MKKDEGLVSRIRCLQKKENKNGYNSILNVSKILNYCILGGCIPSLDMDNQFHCIYTTQQGRGEVDSLIIYNSPEKYRCTMVGGLLLEPTY